jgi:hypothetical protein
MWEKSGEWNVGLGSVGLGNGVFVGLVESYREEMKDDEMGGGKCLCRIRRMLVYADKFRQPIGSRN